MNSPVDTLNYMIAGYVVILGTLAVYVVSLFARWRKLSNEKESLQELQDE